jgi:predicted regulator of Ras-like GTPase activity (Roadblock/LC7/MglB family)
MENLLKEINELSGVRGSFVCDGHGVVLSAAMPRTQRKDVENIGREVVQVVGLLNMLGEETDVLDFLYSDGRILVNGLADLSLVVTCEPNVDMSLVRLKSNVILAEIRRNVRFKRHMEKASRRKKHLRGSESLDESYRKIIRRLRPMKG